MLKKSFLAGIILLMSVTLAGSQASAQVNKQVTQQTTRQISDAIAQRISDSQLLTAGAQQRDLDENAWYSFAYAIGSGDFGVPEADFDADYYQNLLGVDRFFEGMYLGLSLGQAHVDFDDVSGFDSSTFGIDFYSATLYAAFIANEHFFTTLLAGYEFVEFFGSDAFFDDSDNHTGFYEIDLNGLLKRGRLEMIGKAGFRHEFSDSSDSKLDQFYWFTVRGELGFRLGIAKPYLYAEYESVIDQGSADHVGYAGGGVRVDFTDSVNLALEGYTNFAAPEVDEVGGSLRLRVKF